MNFLHAKSLREENLKAIHDMKTITGKANDEKRDMSAEEVAQFDKLHKRAEEVKVQLDRYDTLTRMAMENPAPQEQRAGVQDVNTPEANAEKQAKEQRAAFNTYLRSGQLPTDDETRALTVSGTGVVGDRAVYSSLVTAIKTFAGVREAGATILPTTDGNDLTVPKADDSSNTGQIVGEATEDNTDADPTLASITLKAYKFDSKWIKVSLEMLQDAAYPLENYILNIAGERIGRSFNAYATTGTGTGQPKGVLIAGTAGKTAASQTAITFEELLDLVHSVDAGYRNSPNFRLMFHDTTLAAIRKLKDSAGTYIFSAGAAGAPSRVLDYAYTVNNDMPQLNSGASSRVIAAGDFGRYFVRDVTGITVVRATELFAGSGLVGFRVFSRHDSNLTDANAVKYLKLAA